MSYSKYKKLPTGSKVLLKTLEEICKLEGVKHRKEIRGPYIVSQMVPLLGSEVVVDNPPRPTTNPYFRAKKSGNTDTWMFHFDWIKEDDSFKTELIPDELFEI